MPLTLNNKQKKLIANVTSWKFKLWLLANLPMGLIAGLKVSKLEADHCETSVPYFWWNKNPFRSMYFAVQAMAAELSTASTCLLAVTGQKPSIAFIIVDCKAEFIKKATGKVFFSCTNTHLAFDAVMKCLESGEAKTATFTTTGTMKDGTVVSRFEFTWSFRQRST